MSDEIKEKVDEITELAEKRAGDGAPSPALAAGSAPKTQEAKGPEQPEPQKISVEQILGIYPLDREKARDTIQLEMSRNLNRIANALEGILRLKVARKEERAVAKQAEGTTGPK